MEVDKATDRFTHTTTFKATNQGGRSAPGRLVFTDIPTEVATSNSLTSILHHILGGE